MIKESTNTPLCERGNDLVSFLYGEVNDTEAREFERHLQQCASCRGEATSFSQVRESIGAWKEEALSVFVPPQSFEPAKNRSALSALREFFDLSPLWLKGAVAFATVLFCVMLVLTLSRPSTTQDAKTAASDAKYSENQMKEIVKKALEQHAVEQVASNPNREEQQVSAPVPQPKKKTIVNQSPSQWARRRSLSKSEREQLAADLRLFSTRDEENLNLIGDKINQEF